MMLISSISIFHEQHIFEQSFINSMFSTVCFQQYVFNSMISMHCRVTRDEDHKPVVGENEREQIIQEFLNRKREAEANKARVAQDRREPSQAPWAVNDWNYKINPAKNG